MSTYTKLQAAIGQFDATGLTEEQGKLLVTIVGLVGDLLTTTNNSLNTANAMNANLVNELRLIQNLNAKPPTTTVQ